MDARTQRIRQIGHATRFKPGNHYGQGRPATAKFSKACKQLMREYGGGYVPKSEELARHCLRLALGGSARHAELILRYAGPDAWKEVQYVVKQAIENPEIDWLLRRKPPKRRSTKTSSAGSNRQEDCQNRRFSNTQDVPPQIQAIPQTVPAIHELARELVGIADRPAVEQAPALARRRVKVELW
jgi:hypothetical protein